MDKLRALKYFIEVAESGSFTAAAKKLGVPASSVSRRVQDLESELGATLIYRSTRVVKLTELGMLYLEHIQSAVDALDYADEVVGQHSQVPSGLLRITAIPGYGKFCLEPALVKLKQCYPDIVLDVEMTDQVSNLARNQVDIAIRATASLPDRAVARKLANNQFLLAASPTYLTKFGTPTTVAELLTHKTLLYRGPSGVLNWQAKLNNGWTELRTQAVYISNQGESLVDNAVNGVGIALLPDWGINQLLAEKQLVQIRLDDAEVSISRNSGSGIYLLYHRPKYSVQKVRAAIDFLVSELSEF